MVRLIRYIIYFFLILFCLFWLQKYNVHVKEGFSKMMENAKSFFLDVKNSPKGDSDSIYNEINKQDFIGKLGATSTPVKNATSVKSYENESLKKNLEPAELTLEGIVKYSNIEREKVGLQSLVLQPKLSASALKKANDMLDRQYFEHKSPDGKTAVDLIKEKGYVYQIIGENLALGDFGSDRKLIDAWMNSPAHKANILNPKFTEIGVGLVKGNYQGSTVWLVVQHFGKPLPVCAPVNQTIKRAIDTEKFKLEGEERELQLIANEIEADPNQNKGAAFLEAYNTRVVAYNTRLDTLKKTIESYNNQVTVYNTCLGGEVEAKF